MIQLKDKILLDKNLEFCCPFLDHGKSIPTFWVWLQVKWCNKFNKRRDKEAFLQSDKMLWKKSDQLKIQLLLMPSKKIQKMYKLVSKIMLLNWKTSKLKKMMPSIPNNLFNIFNFKVNPISWEIIKRIKGRLDSTKRTSC